MKKFIILYLVNDSAAFSYQQEDLTFATHYHSYCRAGLLLSFPATDSLGPVMLDIQGVKKINVATMLDRFYTLDFMKNNVSEVAKLTLTGFLKVKFFL